MADDKCRSEDMRRVNRMRIFALRSPAAAAAFATSLTLAAGITGCTHTTPKPNPKPSQTVTGGQLGVRRDQLGVALASCFLNHHLMPQSNFSHVPKKDGHIDTASSSFLQAVADNEDSVTYQHKTLGEWVNQGALDGKTWPTSLCGPMPPWSSPMPSP
ncbi:hypothetical protein ACWDBD_23890 [Streptomyces sp. NPDC001118]